MSISILFIEPDHILGNIYKDYFISKGFKVLVCNDGQRAINTIDKEKPDIIILELQLTAHNGFEFLYELRSYTEWFSIPVIVNTLIPKSRTKLDESSLKGLGVVGYLYKPATSLEKLSSYIENHALIAQT
jgi:DNA-binding response OmpR family regulator